MAPGEKEFDTPALEQPQKKKKKETYKSNIALAGVVQWTEHRSANQNVSGSIPSQGTCPGCGPGPQ